MKFWILAFITLTGQETITTSGLFSIAFTEHYKFEILSIIFITVTLIEIFIFHHLGVKIQKKRTRNIIVDMSSVYILRSEHFINHWGISGFLVFLASAVFPPFLTAFVASWLKLVFHKKLAYIFLGDCIWYLTTWGIVLGTNLLTENPSHLLIRVIGISLLFVIFQRLIVNRVLTR